MDGHRALTCGSVERQQRAETSIDAAELLFAELLRSEHDITCATTALGTTRLHTYT